MAFVADFGTLNFNLKTKCDMENNASTNHKNSNDANRLLPAVFVKGQKYKLRYGTTYQEYCGMYEYIGNRGSKLHFYDNNAGVDVLLSKSDALSAFDNGR